MGLSIAFVIAILIEVALPVFLVIFVVKKARIGWMVIVIGVMIYMIAQTIQVPILSWISGLLDNAELDSKATWTPILEGAILGIVIGIIVEGLRWSAFKYVKQLKSIIPHAIGSGLGYGASETIILVGIPILISFVNMLIYKNANASDPNLQEGLVAQVQALWMLPWYTPLIGAFERITSLIANIALSMMILQVFTRGQIKYLFFAMIWHLLLEAFPVIMSGYGLQTWMIDLLLLVFCGVNIYFMIKLGVFDKLHYQIIDSNVNDEQGGLADV
jgi:uncharacterized membrane protein YhfC